MNEPGIEGGTYELNVDETLRPTLERQLTGTTQADTEIQSLEIPRNPVSIKSAIVLLRIYRKIRPKWIGNRCVFEPSCSHYSEMAIREHGVIVGVWLTVKRLTRCRPGNGGIDFSCKKDKSCDTKLNQ